MDRLSKHRYHRNGLLALVILSMLLQAQAVFACQMMDHSGPVEHCCCDDMMANKDTDDLQSSKSSCCDFSSTLEFKDSAGADEEPAALQLHSAHDLSSMALVLLVAHPWPDRTALLRQETYRNWEPGLASPGTETYLNTLRLRI